MLRNKRFHWIHKNNYIILFIIVITAVAHASGNGTLPVELTYFKGVVQNNSVLLTWETATEVNSYGYDIEKSTDSINYIRIGFVLGSGNSNSPKDYFFSDTVFESSGTYYYRLKQIDNDGLYKYSKIININVQITGLEDIITDYKFELYQNYPNPFNPTTHLRIQIANFGFLSLKIYDILGNEIANLVNEEKPAGEYKITFDGSKLSSGIYFYTLHAGTFCATKKFVLMK